MSTQPRSEAKPFVFAIKRTFAERIIDGHKCEEYRRVRPSLEPGDLILIYETAPQSAIVASARVTRVMVGHMLTVWADTWRQGCVSPEEFAEYFEGAKQAVAIGLTDVIEFASPIKLPPGMAAPQSWARLRIGEWDHWSLAYDAEAGAWRE